MTKRPSSAWAQLAKAVVKEAAKKPTPKRESNPGDQLSYWSAKRSTMEGIAQEAAQGDRECAEDMMHYLAYYTETHTPDWPDSIREYALACLTEVLTGETPDRAFNYTRKASGQPSNYWKAVRDADIARGVEYHRQQGMRREEAIKHVANTYTAFPQAGKPVNRDAVDRAYKRYKRKG